MKKITTIIIVLLAIFSTTVFAKPVLVRSISVKNLQHESVVTIHLSSSTQYRTLMLQRPNRFVIDIKNATSYRRLNFPLRGTGIHDFKYATHQAGFFRLVFGLYSSAHPTTRVIGNAQSHQMGLQIIFPKVNLPHVFHALPIHHVEKTRPHVIAKTHSTLKEAMPKTVLSDAALERNETHRRDVIIVVDPGHGGKDPGATGPGGTHEKTIVLAIGKKLQKWIDKQPGFHADLTRTGDYFLTLRQRLHIARRDKADMFIAIHADIWKNKTAGGVSVFALSQKGATSEAARWLAARENASELMGGVKLNDKSHMLKSVLINLSQAATIRTSLEIGADLIKKIKPIARLHHPHVEQAAFVVLKSPDIPSLLVETGFLSNPNEERRLKNPVYQNKLAHAIMQGIREYFTENPPRGTWLSYWRNHPGVPHKT